MTLNGELMAWVQMYMDKQTLGHIVIFTMFLFMVLSLL